MKTLRWVKDVENSLTQMNDICADTVQKVLIVRDNKKSFLPLLKVAEIKDNNDSTCVEKQP